MLRLIVTADDLGLGPDMDAGILCAHDAGIVTSTSLLVTGATASEAAAEALARPDLSLGLHLCFSQGRPAAPKEEIRSLLGTDGAFVPTAAALFRRSLAPAELDREAGAQWQRFVDLTGRAPDFVNTHQHAQLHPAVFGALTRLCRAHAIGRARLPAEQQPLRPNRRFRSWLWPAATVVALASRRALARAGIAHPDRMVGGPESGRMTHRGLARAVAALRNGTTELVVHPRRSSAELDALSSPDFAAALRARDVRRIPFRAL